MMSLRSVGVIHARGGSTRIPRKNVKPLLGHPLIGYVARAAAASRLERVIISTDDDEIAARGEEYGAEAPFRRPKDISADVPSELVTLHALDWLKDHGETYDVVVSIQPTTPFLLPQDIDLCIEALERTGANACFTARRATQPPQWMFTKNPDDTVAPFVVGKLEGERGVFQSLPPLYLPNGGAYATRCSALYEQKRLIADPTHIAEMPDLRSVDLDEPIDWIIAESIGQKMGYQPVPLKSK